MLTLQDGPSATLPCKEIPVEVDALQLLCEIGVNRHAIAGDLRNEIKYIIPVLNIWQIENVDYFSRSDNTFKEQSVLYLCLKVVVLFCFVNLPLYLYIYILKITCATLVHYVALLQACEKI